MDNIGTNIHIGRDRKVVNIYLISGGYSFNKSYNIDQI